MKTTTQKNYVEIRISNRKDAVKLAVQLLWWSCRYSRFVLECRGLLVERTLRAQGGLDLRTAKVNLRPQGKFQYLHNRSRWWAKSEYPLREYSDPKAEAGRIRLLKTVGYLTPDHS